MANLAKAVTLLPIRAQKKAIDDHARPGYPFTNTTTLFAGITISADAVNPCRPLPLAMAARQIGAPATETMPEPMWGIAVGPVVKLCPVLGHGTEKRF